MLISIFFLAVQYSTDSSNEMHYFCYDIFRPENIFKSWWSFQLAFYLVINLVAQKLILVSMEKKDDYNGYVGRRYPYTEQPRIVIITPRRDVLEDIVKDKKHRCSPVPSTSFGFSSERKMMASSSQTSRIQRTDSGLEMQNNSKERDSVKSIQIALEEFNRNTKSKWTKNQKRMNHLLHKPETVIKMPDVSI